VEVPPSRSAKKKPVLKPLRGDHQRHKKKNPTIKKEGLGRADLLGGGGGKENSWTLQNRKLIKSSPT